MALHIFVILTSFCETSFAVPKYIFHNVKTSSLVADQTCQDNYGTHLASIHSAQDNAEAQSLCEPQSGDDRPGCWIGLHDFHDESYSNGANFIWYDGSALDYQNWRPGEPNEWYSHNGGEDLVDIVTDSGQWNDELNGRELRLICWNPEYNAPTAHPTLNPTLSPTNYPIAAPTYNPTLVPTFSPTAIPTSYPTIHPTSDPTFDPTMKPTFDPTSMPTNIPTLVPTVKPTTDPTIAPIHSPTIAPIHSPTTSPTTAPIHSPTLAPTYSPTLTPTVHPTFQPTIDPTMEPTIDPTNAPTVPPTNSPTHSPTVAPTARPTLDRKVIEVTDSIMVTGAAHQKGATSNINGNFIESNSTTIAYVLAILLASSCVVIIMLCYTERSHNSKVNVTDLHEPLLIRLSSSKDGKDGVELTQPIDLIHGTLSFIVDNTESIASDEDDGESESLYNYQNDMQQNEKQNKVTATVTDKDDSGDDDMYDAPKQTVITKTPQSEDDESQSMYVLKTPMGYGEL